MKKTVAMTMLIMLSVGTAYAQSSYTIYDERWYPTYKVQCDQQGNCKVYDLKGYLRYRIEGQKIYDSRWYPRYAIEPQPTNKK